MSPRSPPRRSSSRRRGGRSGEHQPDSINRELDLLLALNEAPRLRGNLREDRYGRYELGSGGGGGGTLHAELQRYERERRRRREAAMLGRR